jgi:hypothetical protein
MSASATPGALTLAPPQLKALPLETLNLYALLRERIWPAKAAPRHWLFPQFEE